MGNLAEMAGDEIDHAGLGELLFHLGPKRGQRRTHQRSLGDQGHDRHW
jgi:hypothetical protein